MREIKGDVGSGMRSPVSERLQVEHSGWRTDLSDCSSTDFGSDEEAVVFRGGSSLQAT